MTDWNAIGAFIGSVIAWPGSDEPGWANLQWSYVDKRTPGGKRNGKYPVGNGLPYRDPSLMINRAAWVNNSGFNKDVWFCTSLQSTTKLNKQGKTVADRSARNALLQKSIWIDMDVGENDPKKYPTMEDALKAVVLFRKTVGLPRPSAIVKSGGGIHVYWISKLPLTPQEWQPFASGLRNMMAANNLLCDGGLTTDIARILRFPGTFNHKYDPPKPVELLDMPLKLYDFPTQLAAVLPFAGPTAPTPHSGPSASIFADGADMSTFAKPHEGFKGRISEPGLDAGIDKFGNQKIAPEDIQAIFKECPMYQGALFDGGAGIGQSLWNQMVLGTTFMENGDAIAHLISKGHAEYAPVDTQALYDRKVAERTNGGIGWPSCSTFEANGCTSCAGCPLKPKGKSPLNIRHEVTAPVTQTAPLGQSPAAVQVGLPAGYDLNADGIICKVIEKPSQEGESFEPTYIPLFQAQLSDFRLRKEPGEQIEFRATADKGHSVDVSVQLESVGALGFGAALLKKRVLITFEGEKHLKEFFLSIIGKLRALMAAQVAVPFGWYDEDGKRRGFSFGGTLFMDDGSERSATVVDANLARKFTPCGTLEQWKKAAATVTGRKRQELNSIMLLSFASPLLALNGKNTAVLAAFGKDSGAGKTSAVRVGISVWGHPITSMKLSNTDTANSIMGRMSKLRHLPFYWDEVRGMKAKQKLAEVITQTDGGSEKSRMLSGTEHQDTGSFQLMLMYTANSSLVEFLQKTSLDTVAPQMRTLEYGPVQRINGGPGHMMDADAEILLNGMQNNFGTMGMVYAKFLAMNHVAITEEFRLKCNEMETMLTGGTSERYWYTTIAVMTLAAKYAQQLGLDVDPVLMEKFMIATYRENEARRNEYTTDGTLDNSEDAMARWLRERENNERGVWTDKIHLAATRPPRDFVVRRIAGPNSMRNAQGAVEFRYAQDNMVLFITNDFKKWLDEKEHSTASIMSDLKKVYRMIPARLPPMSGLISNAGRQYGYLLQIMPDTPLWEHMLSHASPEERDALLARAPTVKPLDAKDVDTGLGPRLVPDPPAEKIEPIETGFEFDENGVTTAASVGAWVRGAKVA